MFSNELHGGKASWLVGISTEHATGYLAGNGRSGGWSRLLCEKRWDKGEKYTGKNPHEGLLYELRAVDCGRAR
jgi:hypothetical protein